MAALETESIFRRDSRILYIIEYVDGFVPFSVIPCYHMGVRYWFDGMIESIKYDARRKGGRGPKWVAYSVNKGRLASG